jgi:primosomal protein N'
MPALMHRRQYHYRELLWLQSDNRTALHMTINQLLDALNQPKMAISGVRVFLDVDPQDMP